jgi:signal transduction histidine kinase
MSAPVLTDVESLRARSRQMEAINAAALRIHASLEPRHALQLLVSEAVRLTGATSGSLILLNPNSNLLEIETAIGLPRTAAVLRLPLGKGITGWVAKNGVPACVGDVRADPRYVMVRPEVRSELAVPLLVDNEMRGALNVDSEQINAFSSADEDLLNELARHAVIVVRNTWLFEQARRRTDLATALARIARVMNSAFGLDEVLQLIAREAVHLLNVKLSSVLMVGDDPACLDLRASHGAGPDYLGRGRLAIDESLVGVVLRRSKPLQVEDVRSSRLYQGTEVARREGLVSLLSVPLIFGGEARGVLNVYSGDRHTFSNEEIQTLSALAQLSSIAIERARLAERMARAEEELRRDDKLCALGLLAAEVAHEIRNPLTVMKMLYHSLDLEFPTGDPRIEDVRVIGEKMDLLNRIVERVLDFARHAEPRFEDVSLPEILDDLHLLTRQKLRSHNVELVLQTAGEIPGFRADPMQLEQAFLNLMLNAIEAMPQGGRLMIRSELTGAGPGRQVVLTFADTGTGLVSPPGPPSPGRLLGSTKARGSGLGLAIVTRVVETHRGQIEFASKAGEGTTVTIRFPLEARNGE